jgi:argininosuccinate lyase
MAAATYLTHKGVPFRKAHEKIGQAVRLGLETGRELNELTLEELRGFGEEFGEDFFDAISLQATLDCHNVIGGTARNRVRDAMEDASRQIASDRASLASKKSAKLGLESPSLV